MCPDKQILSVYFDGELPARFRRLIEDHLASCGQCGRTLASFAVLSAKLSSGEDDGVSSGAALLDAARERVWNKLSAQSLSPDNGGLNIAGRRKFPGMGVLRKRVSVPLPFAAAAGLLLVFAAAVLFNQFAPLRPQPPAPGIIARPLEGPSDMYYGGAGGENFMTQAGAPANMAEVLHYLNNSGADVVDIRLPGSRNFSSSGEPKLINAANYAGSGNRR
jgi:hypothetical protein